MRIETEKKKNNWMKLTLNSLQLKVYWVIKTKENN